LIEHELVQVFTAQTAQSLPTALNPEEVQAARWVPLTDLMAEIAADPAPFTPWLRIYLDQHRTQIFGTTAQL
jgi:isopentenyl-diphosphate delta-isomerase